MLEKMTRTREILIGTLLTGSVLLLVGCDERQTPAHGMVVGKSQSEVGWGLLLEDCLPVPASQPTCTRREVTVSQDEWNEAKVGAYLDFRPQKK